MADNLELLKQELDLAIDPNAGPGQILAQKHNDYATSMINKLGKYVGSPFNAKNNYTGVIALGDFHIQGALNEAGQISIITSKLTNDLNDFGIVLATLSTGDLIHFKDVVGRSCYFRYIYHIANIDNNYVDIYQIVVEPDVTNINYTYQSNEVKPCVIELVSGRKNVVPYLSFTIYKASGNTSNELEVGDVASGWIDDVTFIPLGRYLGPTPDDINSWDASPYTF